MTSAGNTAEWEAQVETIIEKSTEKMKEQTRERDELQSKIFKLTLMLQQEEKIKDTIRERTKQTHDETGHQLKARLDYETDILKRTEELKKLCEDVRGMREKVEVTGQNFDKEVSDATIRNARNEDERKRGCEKESIELAIVQQEKEKLSKEYEVISQELQALQVKQRG